MTELKPRVRVKARTSSTQVARVSAPPTMRYLRADSAGILPMRRAVVRDARQDVWEAAERASALALDFMHNSGWMAGAADQVVADTNGVELALNARPDLSRLGYDSKEQADWARLVQREFRRYAWNPREVDLAGKMTLPEMLDAVVRHYLVYGEGFGITDFIPRAHRARRGIETGSKVTVIAPHRCPRTTREIEGLDHGIFHDGWDRAVAYLFKRRRAGVEVVDQVVAGNVIHVMDRGENAGSPRGISVMAPILKVVAQSDQLADATLATALMQTIMAATIKSPEPSEEAFDAIRTLGDDMSGIQGVSDLQQDLIDVWINRIDALKEKGISMSESARINHLGPGEEFEMHTASTPGSQYLPFSKNLSREAARRIGISASSYTMDFSDASYASVRMEGATIWPIAVRRRERISAPFAQGVYEPWLQESIAEGRIPLKGGLAAFLANRSSVCWAEWRGPEQPSADPYKDALANKVNLETGATTLQRIYAAKGQDWEEEIEQAGKEIEALTDIGMAVPHGRSRGGDGAGPLGGAADGDRVPQGGSA